MQLTLHTDYSLRVLIYLALHTDRLVTIVELAEFFNISKNHLVKIVHKLGVKGYIKTMRGKGGGICLAQPPETISIGHVIRNIEANFYIAECFSPGKQGHCAIQPLCGLTVLFSQATAQFLAVLDAKTLADVIDKI